jgi:hypothetical protein
MDVVFASRQQRVRLLEALERRAKQFRSRDGTWPFRVPHDPLDLADLIESAALDGERPVDPASLRARTLLSFSWHSPAEAGDDGDTWDLWVIALPSGILIYCDSDGQETRILASAKRGNPGEADGFFLERLAETRGHLFGIEMAGAVPDRVRSSIGDRDFLADVFVDLFEGTDAEAVLSAECSVLRAQCSVPSADREVPSAARDFRTTVAIWLDRVLTAPPPGRRQPRLRDQPEAL